MRTIQCPNCGNILSENEEKCKYCGSSNPIFSGAKKEETAPINTYLAKQASDEKKIVKKSLGFGIASLSLFGGAFVSYPVLYVIFALFTFVMAIVGILTFGLGLLILFPAFAVLALITVLSPVICVVLGTIFGAVGLGLSKKIINDTAGKDSAKKLCLAGLICNVALVIATIVLFAVSIVLSGINSAGASGGTTALALLLI